MEAPGYLSENIKVTVDGPTTAGTSEVDSTTLDMQGYDSVLFIARIGTPATNNYAKGQEDSDSAMGTVQDLASSKASSDAATIKNLMIDVQRPVKRYVRTAVIRGTSTTVDAIVAIQYNARSLPSAQLAASVLTQLMGPAEGTA